MFVPRKVVIMWRLLIQKNNSLASLPQYLKKILSLPSRRETITDMAQGPLQHGSPPSLGRQITLIFTCFVLFLLINCFFLLPDEDAYYYWSWGQHLAFGYLDGPPLAAYFMRGFSEVFGNTLFALNFYAVCTTLITSFFIFKISALLSTNKQISFTAALLWLISYSVQHNLIFCGATYDNLEALFWTASIYLALKYINTRLNRYLYFTAISIGLLLLSKYTGVTLLLGLLVFFIFSPDERTIFKNKHLYCAALLALLVFSPNLLWNAQHQWLTFTFQSQAHSRDRTPVISLRRYVRDLLNYYLYPFVLIIFFRIKFPPITENKKCWQLLWVISGVLALFWLTLSLSSNVRISYLTNLNVLLMCLLAHYLIQFDYRKTLWFTVVASLLLVLVMVIKFEFLPNARQSKFEQIKQIGNKYLKENKLVIIGGNDYQLLSQLAFNNPDKIVSSSPICDKRANQFHYWDIPFQQKLMAHQVSIALYVDFQDTSACITPYFNTCSKLTFGALCIQ